MLVASLAPPVDAAKYGSALRGRDTIAERLGWGVLGAAGIARGAVLPAIPATKNGRVVAIASRDPERARRLAEGYPEARAAESYEALLADPRVDAVYIPLVNSVHKEWTLRALAAGKHVLCEKPLAMNAHEAEEMVAAAESAGKHLMEAFMYRFHPRMGAFVEALRDPIYLQASFGFALSDKSNYRLHAQLGGGALLDVGCYVVSLARWILGEPSHVLARSKLVDGVDMTTTALLEFSGGETASVWASFESPEEQELTVVTRERVTRLERPFNSPDEIDPYQLMVESFADSVLRDRPLAIPPGESIANMKVLDRIREVAASP
ncbi:MAG TPA: Gfo/Idh/MocA family oxidoreductase [Candidatus Dormibacteraeota bacterium]|nr:Gfo/Idh/MocA family oxidoreductase [Candidatus Dormibacteraeota bacterium]